MKSEAHKIIEEIETKAFQKGFQAGWTAAKLATDDLLKRLPSKIPTVLDSIEQDTVNSENPFRAGTKSASVYDYIKTHPGKRGVDIFKVLGIETKLGRTALYRMKEKKIAINENGWRIL